MKYKQEIHSISQDEFDKITCSMNRVFVEVDDNQDFKTDSGIFLAVDEDYNPQFSARRYGRIIKMPSELVYDHDKQVGFSMPWKTKIEALVGDEVWFTSHGGNVSPIFRIVDNGKEYTMMGYQDLLLARRDGLLIPLNGVILFEDEEPDVIKSDYIDIVNNKKYKYDLGVVYISGNANEEYANGYFTDNIADILPKGTKIVLNKSFAPEGKFPLLEEKAFARLDKELRYCYRYMITFIFS